MANSITLYPLGVGSFGAAQLYHISFLLRVEGRSIVIDCPRRLFDMLAFNAQHGEYPVTVADYQDILLTHLHIDHAGGIVELAHADIVPNNQPFNLYAPSSTFVHLWSDRTERGVVSAAQISGGAATLDRNFRARNLANPHDFGSFALYYRATSHISNTFAYLFDFGNYKLGYSADTAYDEELIVWLDQCDLILHDALLPPWSEDEEVQKLHPPLSKLLALPESFQQKTYLCHYDETTYLDQEIGSYQYLEQNRLYHLIG